MSQCVRIVFIIIVLNCCCWSTYIIVYKEFNKKKIEIVKNIVLFCGLSVCIKSIKSKYGFFNISNILSLIAYLMKQHPNIQYHEHEYT